MNMIISQELAQVILNHFAGTPHIYAEVFQIITQLQALKQEEKKEEVKLD